MHNWSGDRCVIVAGGPSVTDYDISLIRAHQEPLRIIVVNDAWRLLTGADVLYAADLQWWTTYWERVVEYFRGQMWSCDDRLRSFPFPIHIVPGRVGYGLPESKDFIKLGALSGNQAIQLAYIWGCTRIALLGFDCRYIVDARGNPRTHWFGDHPPSLTQRHPYDSWIEETNILAKELAASGVSVTNCSPQTALRCFPQRSLKEWL